MPNHRKLTSGDDPTTWSPSHANAEHAQRCSPCHFPSLNKVTTSESRSVDIPIQDNITRIQAFCEDVKISVSTIFQVAWGLVLRAYTGQDSTCFGVIVAGADDLDAIGRSMPVSIRRVEFSNTDLISDIIQRVHMDCDERYAMNQIASLDGTCSIRMSDDMDLFNTCMSFPRKERERKEIADIKTECARQDYCDQYDILIRCQTGSVGLSLVLDYQAFLLSDEQATSIANTFQQAISSCMENNELVKIRLLNDLDKAQIYKWNKDAPLRFHCCIDTLIYERCLAQPMAPAVCAWDGDFSYGELESFSSTLARHLSKQGVKPEVFVPLCFEKSRWTTVAMLGVTKAGGAFVLLDPSQPPARLLTICESFSARLIVASTQHTTLAAGLVTTVVKVGDGEAEWLADKGPRNPSLAKTENALYAVFTSGSTGTPKGVVSEHRSFHAAILPFTKAANLDQHSRVFQFSSYAFDVTIFDTFMTLIKGGCVCVPSDTDRWTDAASTMQRFQVSHVSLTPTVARILDLKDLQSLRTLVLGGEKPALGDIGKWVERVRVVNLYGASECSLMSIQVYLPTERHLRKLNTSSSAARVPVETECFPRASNSKYGTEVVASTFRTNEVPTGSLCWIVDPSNHDRLLPIGAIGELVIEGPLVGRGYLNNAERMESTFIQPPAWLHQLRGSDFDVQGTKLYKSGDLAQYTANGSLRFMGRANTNTQVKLRGQRIELGEVEYHVKRSFPDARDVVVEVVATLDPSRPPMLIAFVRGHDTDANLSDRGQILAELTEGFRSQIPISQAELQQSLPSYMVPAAFLPLAILPLTSTHKINRKLLRDLAAELEREELERYLPLATAEVRRAPQTSTERLLQQLFARVLNLSLEQVGADDHFFYRGGNSLTAMKLVAMARKDENQKLTMTVQDVFLHPRLSALAQIVRSRKGENSEELPPAPFSLITTKQRDVIRAAAQQCNLPTRAIEDIYPCTPLQQGFMSATMRDPAACIAEVPLFLPANIDIQRLQAAWISVANANPILRTRMVLSASHAIFQVVVRENIRWTASGARNFAVGIGKPLVELFLCPDSEGGSVQNHGQLFMMIHHAIYDGWTLPLIFAEVEAAYHGNTIRPNPATPFVRYIQSIPDGETYWNSLMSDLHSPVFPPLPSGIYQPSPHAVIKTTITTPGPSAGQFTANTHLRLAWAITQAQHQGTSDVFFGTVVSGRNAPIAGIESMTAPTVATIPCRIILDHLGSARSALHKIQDDMITGIPFEQLGLPNLRRLGEHAALACSFQTLLVMQPIVKPGNLSWLEERELDTDYRADVSYAINIICSEGPGELKVTALYDTNVVKEEDMLGMLGDFGNALQSLHKSPDRLIREMLVRISH